ncbi:MULTISPECIES: hypothetical protein [unclassified Leptolyngbya]|uniref:hypothetical protein n=1 Tax=unclassified Leptolyngbya TaxID=2650499 RepID=UPI001AC56C5D|nr:MULTISPECIES: hypothetical protein [unclassified Leptolyngbya]MBN8562168.1 hypothetical protein [Leptolyngbya sp. UWPOB_LEPTO1]MCY6494363.1 hypothetical protein [Leptolyngbya sp. GGD]
MSKPLHAFVQVSGMLAILLSATYSSPSKASAQSLLPDISLIEGGQVCLALCTSTPTQGAPNQGLGALPAQLMQLPGQVLQLPGQILSSQSSQVMRSNLPILPPGGAPMIPPGAPQGLPPGAPPQGLPLGAPQGLPPGALPPGAPPQGLVSQAPQSQRTSFLKKIAPVLPVVIQQLAK